MNNRTREWRRPTQAVILAGGRGTRMRPLTDTRPKPMIEFHGKPFLAYTIEMLREQGFDRVLLLLGYLPDVIQDYFGDGSKWGIEIRYSVSLPDDLTVKRIQLALDQIDDCFMLLYCDNYWPLQMDRMWARFEASGAPAMVTVYGNKDGYSRDSVRVNEDGWVTVYDRSRTAPRLRGVEISYAILTRPVLEMLPTEDALFEEAIYPRLAAEGRLAGWVSDHRYYSVGSLERLPLTTEFFARRPAILLDRDGVLNRRPARACYVRRPEEFEWLPGALDGLRLLREQGYRVIVASNQAGVARGAMTAGDLDELERCIRSQAEVAGGGITAFYDCTHDWDAGCECRKPRPGLLFRAQREHHLDLTRTLYVGDDERDRMAAEAAGCRFAQVDENRSLLDIIKEEIHRTGEMNREQTKECSHNRA
ncbi:MAG TPA: HAD-IIIA family hydrolase [Bryobacteraceae bacterium]|nr:HAD-IIIA family hydrolase [Bryobacteraceae bacterium]